MALSKSIKARNESAGPFSGFLTLPCFGIAFLRLFAYVAPSAGSDTEYLYAIQLLAILILIVLDRFVSYSQRTVTNFVVVATIGMALGGVFTYFSLTTWMFTLGHILRGACSGVLIVGIGLYLCSIKLQFAVISVTGGFTFYSLCIFAFPALSETSDIISIIFFALGTGFCLLWGLEKTSLEIEEEKPSLLSSLRTLPPSTGFVATVSVLYALLNVFCQTTPYQQISSYLWVILYVAFFALSLVWIIRFNHKNADVLLTVFIALLFLGPLFYAFFNHFSLDLASGVLQGIKKCYMMMVWIYLVSAAKSSRLSAVFLFGMGNILLLQCPRVVKSLMSPLVELEQSAQMLVSSIFVFLAALVLIGLVVRMFVIGRKKMEEQATNAAIEIAKLVQPSQIVAEKYALSAREEEVAGYLMQGYSIPEIAKRMFISTETVKSHCKNVYQKVGVHSKQELLALVEKM